MGRRSHDQGGSGGTANLQPGNGFWLSLRGLQRRAGREAREGPGKIASVVARVAALRDVAVVAPASGAQRPGEGGRRRERGWVSRELAPRALCRTAVSPTPGQPGTQGAGRLEKCPARVRVPWHRNHKTPLARFSMTLGLRGALLPLAPPPNPPPFCPQQRCPNHCSVHLPHLQGPLP